MIRLGLFLYRIIRFYETLIIVWCILSWIPIRREGLFSDIVQAIDRLVSPYMNIFRRYIPPVSAIDFSPVVGMLALEFIGRGILRILVF